MKRRSYYSDTAYGRMRDRQKQDTEKPKAKKNIPYKTILANI